MTTDIDHEDPANRVLNQWKGTMYGTHREVLVTEYGDHSLTVAWRADRYATWSPWVDLKPAP